MHELNNNSDSLTFDSPILPLCLSINVQGLYQKLHDKTVGINDIVFSIYITMITTKGLCFVSECVLPNDYYIIVDININSYHLSFSEEVMIRSSFALNSSQYLYECEFTKISPKVANTLVDYYREAMS